MLHFGDLHSQRSERIMAAVRLMVPGAAANLLIVLRPGGRRPGADERGMKRGGCEMDDCQSAAVFEVSQKVVLRRLDKAWPVPVVASQDQEAVPIGDRQRQDLD